MPNPILNRRLLNVRSSLLNGIISYWKLEGNSIDSVDGNHGTDTNTSYSIANGKILQGCGFNDVSSKINIPSSTSLNSPTTSVSFSMWVNADNSAAEIFAIKYIVAAGGDYWFSKNGANRFSAQSAGGTGAVGALANLSTGTWYHLCLVWVSGVTLKFYIDGVLQGTDTSPGTISSTAFGMDIGSYNSSTFFGGKIDEIGLWKRDLTDSEVLKLYNNGNGLTYPFA